MKEKWTILNILRHARHDWMNQLQLIKGNLELNNIDRAKEMMNEIVFLAQQETKLSNLQLPWLAELLITFNWAQHRFKLDYKVNGNHPQFTINDQQITMWTESFFMTLDQVVDPNVENHLLISIEKQDELAHFIFEFTGLIVDIEKMNQFLFHSNYSSINTNINVYNDRILMFEIYI